MKKINKILVANRGEIAARIFKTCTKMGITSIAVYSDADKDSLFVKEANQAIYIGASNPNQSYLNQDKIIEAAKKVQADAIHPGYGFLSENAAFAERCQQEGIVFIGPNAAAIKAMASKSAAKKLMAQNNVPVIPGYNGSDQSVAILKTEAQKIGFPVLLKASAGGGGKGMRIVHNSNELKDAISAAKREAKNAFGDDDLIVEKYIASGRHIEFQIFGDQHGNIIHLFERECSIQRRYQKVMEESPSPVLTNELRDKMGAAAILAAKSINYDNAGTVEFIFEESTNQFYFLEVNTRLQVEHPVTETITGLDLVEWQINAAMGLPLAKTQTEINTNGYAIEVRLYAEDAANNFTPVTGKIAHFKVPEVDGLRVETAIESGSEVSVFYDPMIAKIIVWDVNRTLALQKMHYVLKHIICQGITTNLPFLIYLLENENIQKGNYDTNFIENNIDVAAFKTVSNKTINEAVIAATLFLWHKRNQTSTLLKGLPSGWRNSFYKAQSESFVFNEEAIEAEYRYLDQKFQITINEQVFEAAICKLARNQLRLSINGLQKDYTIAVHKNEINVHCASFGNISLKRKERFPKKEKEKIKGGYEAPMPSQIIKILIKEGDAVKTNDPLMIISSMKMENTITAQEDGMVETIHAEEGKNVEAGYLLVKINAT